jgi:hypothetical protein
MKMQFLAVAFGVAAFAILSVGRPGRRKYPATDELTFRKNSRRLSCGLRQKMLPRTFFQSIFLSS